MAVTVMAMSACKTEETKTPAIDLTNLDTEVLPSEDFYRYATGGWMKKNPLKPEYARYGVFNVLADNNEKRLSELFNEVSASAPVPGSDGQKISDLYKMGLDSARLNREGAAPLAKGLAQINGITDRRSMMEVIAGMHSCADFPFFSAEVMSDMADSDVNVLYFSQSGLGMSDRDYYLNPEDSLLKAGYASYLEKILGLAGVEDAGKAAEDAMTVENAIAEASWSSVELRDVLKSYNPMTTAQLKETYPNIDFGSWFRSVGMEEQDKVIVSQPSYFSALDTLFNTMDIEVLKHYLATQYISGACQYLSDDFYSAWFDFFQKQMAGVEAQKPRWKRALAVADAVVPEAVGRLYVEKYFPEEQKAMVSGMVENIRTALKEHIDSLEWMSDSTKEVAIAKLEAFTPKIGYPDKWKDYSTLIINPTLSYCDNVRNASRWMMADNYSRVGKPVDKAEWLMSPQTVNAYYNPMTNEICFPAAILQPPFFNPDADDAVNYGAIGVVISHEMTHGFDDQGRHFDKDGNMTDWWTADDAAAFKAKTDILVAQFDSVDVLPGLKANGALCLGENIADQGGLRVAYTALQNSFGGVHPEPIDGFTAEQRFYISYATVWAMNITDEEKARLTKLDVHSLGENRVNVTLRNLQTFFDAFGIGEGDGMYRPEEERVVIW